MPFQSPSGVQIGYFDRIVTHHATVSITKRCTDWLCGNISKNGSLTDSFQSPSGVQIGYNHQYQSVYGNAVSITKRCTDWLRYSHKRPQPYEWFQSPSGVQIGYVLLFFFPYLNNGFNHQAVYRLVNQYNANKHSLSGFNHQAVYRLVRQSGVKLHENGVVSITKRCTDWLRFSLTCIARLCRSFNHQAVYRLVSCDGGCIWLNRVSITKRCTDWLCVPIDETATVAPVSITKRCTDWLFLLGRYLIKLNRFQSPSGVQIG